LTDALDDSFETWIGLFSQLVQSNPKVHFGIKKNALKCLNVIFRDLVNYSRSSIPKILEPCWKLLTVNLAVYTEVVGYNRPIEYTEAEKGMFTEEERRIDRLMRVDSDIELNAPSSLVGMTMSLLELLTTLMTKGAVRGVIEPALVPVITSITSYMILAADEEVGDDLSYFTSMNN